MNRNKLSLAITMLVLGLNFQNDILAATFSKNQDSVTWPDVTERQALDRTPAWKQLDYFVQNSDVAFRGVVSNIQYKLAKPQEPGQAEIPYTFVTYDVKELIHGNIDDRQVVLRFIGGLNENTMRFMSASNAPEFDLGDDDILFVRGNTKSISPLVLNDRGRFRVVDEQVFSNTGREVTLDKKGNLQYGKRHRLQEILSTTVTGNQGTMVMEHKVVPDAVLLTSRSITAEDLILNIRKLNIPARESAKFVNADIYAELIGPSMKPATVPEPLIKEIARPEAKSQEEMFTVSPEKPAPRRFSRD